MTLNREKTDVAFENSVGHIHDNNNNNSNNNNNNKSTQKKKGSELVEGKKEKPSAFNIMEQQKTYWLQFSTFFCFPFKRTVIQ